MGLDPASVAAVDGSRRDATDAARGGSVLPLARGYAFAEIPPTVERLLAGGEGGLPRAALGDAPDRVAGVVLVFLDAFGWRFFTRHADRHPLLRRFLEHGTVAKLTTQFPSTTVAHVTTIHTGRPVAEHGMYEWNMYDPSVGALVTPLMFSYAGDGERDTLRGAGADPHAMYPDRDALSPPGRPRRAVRRLPPGLVRAVDLRRGPRRRRDAVPLRHPGRRLRDDRRRTARRRAGLHVRVHRHRRRDRPSVRPVLAGVRRRGDPLPRRDRGRDPQAPGRHAGAPRRRPRPGRGRSRAGPASSTSCGRASARICGATRRGRPIAPAGSARDLFLHTAPGSQRHVIDRLRALLGADAEVHATADLVAEGLFGGDPGPRLRARIGDVCVLPAPGETVWWRERGRFGMRFRGHHGGLTPDEAHTLVASLVVP